ncbi:MAG TPA: head GIN domain-containing protein [Ignavibacteriales bacterium]|nr:head GIN domain-containing protein [Ignavibacteriales bacterium]
MRRNLLKGLYLSMTVMFLAFSLISAQETRKFDYKDFNKVEAGYGMHVQITQGNNYSVEVKASKRDFEHLKVDKHGRTLEFTMKGWFTRRQDEITINITMPKLTAMQLSGGSKGMITMDNTSDNFKAELSGGAKLKGRLKCANASFDLSGGSWVSLEGTGKNLSVDGSGGSSFKLKDFKVTNVNSELSGGSEAEVNMNGKLNADQSGGSRIIYYGNATLGRTDMSGGSSVTKGE